MIAKLFQQNNNASVKNTVKGMVETDRHYERQHPSHGR